MADRTGPSSATYALDARCRLVADSGRLVLVSDQSAAVLRGTTTPGVIATGLTLLDGTLDQQAIADRLGVPVEQWDGVVDRLVDAGLARADPTPDRAPVGTASAVELLGAVVGAPDDAERHDLAEARLHLSGRNASVLDAVAEAWSESGGHEPTSGPPDSAPPGAFWVHAAVDDDELTEVNRAALAARTPWLQLPAYDGEVLTVGPLHVPGQTCCAECVRIRRAANAPYPTPARSARLLASPRMHRAPVVARLQAELAVLVAARYLLNPNGTLVGTAHTLALPTLRSGAHRVLRVPRCPACSPAAERAVPYPWTRSADVVG